MESTVPIRHTGELKAFRLDEASSTLWYLGFAGSKSLTGDPVWQIKRLTLGPGNSIVAEWADGDVEFDNIWDNRASLAYL